MPVTQLYVSVDASTKDSLKKIDRPLFKDYWPRFLDSLRALGEKVMDGVVLRNTCLSQVQLNVVTQRWAQFDRRGGPAPDRAGRGAAATLSLTGLHRLFASQ